MKFNTKLLHSGIEPDASTGAIMTPIFQTSTYVQDAPGDHKGYEYARTGNPTRKVLEDNIAALESCKYGAAFGSGMAALDTVMKLLKPGDEVISTNDLYGGSFRAMTKVFQKFGMVFHFVDMTDIENVKARMNPNTKLIWMESPTNPMLNIIDIKAISDLAKEYDVWTCVDNTFASPYLQRPAELGADIILHSATKYLGGHSDVVLGTLSFNDDDLAEQIYFIQNGTGAVCGPQDSFLVLRGIKTLHVRMDRACDNAEKIADYLKNQPKVERVIYPGFEDHKNHDVAKQQMKRFGGMVSFTLNGDNFDQAKKVLSNTQLFSLAESLGGVESLIGHPASMTHASIPKEERMKTGVVDSLIRLSVGIEDIDDLIMDLDKSLQTI